MESHSPAIFCQTKKTVFQGPERLFPDPKPRAIVLDFGSKDLPAYQNVLDLETPSFLLTIGKLRNRFVGLSTKLVKKIAIFIIIYILVTSQG